LASMACVIAIQAEEDAAKLSWLFVWNAGSPCRIDESIFPNDSPVVQQIAGVGLYWGPQGSGQRRAV
jgi:hypothetical protein